MKKSSIVVLLVSACAGDASVSEYAAKQPLTVRAACASSVPEDAWTCGETKQVECDNRSTAAPLTITYEASACAAEYKASPELVSAPGTYTVQVTDVAAAPVCTATLVVVDTTPPVLTAKNTALWPPNHKLHRFTPADCVAVEDHCDDDVKLWFTRAASSEAADARADGATDADIVNLGCDGVELRAERSGQGGGRVYTLSVTAEDASGNRSSAECTVSVAHDQGKKKGAAAAATPAYALTTSGCDPE